MDARQRTFARIITIIIALLLILGTTGAGRANTSAPAQSFIVTGSNTETVARLVEQHGGTVTSRLNLINGVGATLTEASKTALLADPQITAITPNASVLKADPTPPTDYPDVTGADLVWKEGDLGSGVTVAIVDTGLGWHQGLFKPANGKSASRIVAYTDFVEGKKLPQDPNGHGTHIAGIIANTQKGSDKEWNGMAPGVNLVGVRVLDENGQGTYEGVIQGVQWVVDHKDQYKIRIMNLSLLAEVQSPYWADPLNLAAMAAWQNGIIVVVAAGNGGPGPTTVNVPGNNPYVITVGAFTDAYTPDDWSDDYIASFSAAGPTLDGFVKPDLVAPGAHMTSTMMPYSQLARDHNAEWDGKAYFSMAGTSQAAAVVTGTSALILSKYPTLTPDQVKFRLLYTAIPWVTEDGLNTAYSAWQMGAGRVNAYSAVYGEFDNESANQGLDIAAELADTIHYEGYSYYDEATGTYRLEGDYNDTLPEAFINWSGAYGPTTGKFGIWSGGKGIWSGGKGIWSGGKGIWSGGKGIWSGGKGIWSGKFGIWSGGKGIWSGGLGIWSGGMGIWSGGKGIWSGQKGTWSGGKGVWSGSDMSSTEVQEGPTTPTISIGHWVEENRATH